MRKEVEWSGQIEYLGMQSAEYPSCTILSNPALNPKTSIILYKLHIRPIPPPPLHSSNIQSLVKVQNRCLRLVLHVLRRTTLAALKSLVDGEDMQEFLDKLKRGFFKKTLATLHFLLLYCSAYSTHDQTILFDFPLFYP
ncbi:hypothetical protein Trydic_g4323 [Trypoxylus dichotomus]